MRDEEMKEKMDTAPIEETLKAAYAGTAVPRSPTRDSARRLRMLRELPRLSVGALAVFTIGLLMLAVSAVVH